MTKYLSEHLSLCLLFILSLSTETFFLAHISAEGPPRKTDITNDKKIIFAHVKEQLELKCPIEIADKVFVDWYKGDLTLYNEQGYTITKKGSLKIKSVVKANSGTYTCEAVNGYGFVRVNVTVIVVSEVENRTSTHINQNSASRVNGVAPVIKRRPTAHFVDDVGGQVTFHCVASGDPSPHIFWFKDGGYIEHAEHHVSTKQVHSTLRLRDLKKKDAGVYKCIAKNKVGEDEEDYTLQVEDPSYPPRIVALDPISATVKEGATAIFWCQVKSKPGLKLHIKWLKRLNVKEVGDPMNLDDVTLFRAGTTYYRPLNLSDGGVGTNGIHESKLILENTNKHDSGIYVCLALNDKGYNFKNSTLTVINAVTPLSSPDFFSANDPSFVATGVVSLVIILAAIMMVTYFYRRGQKKFRNQSVVNDENIKQIAIKKHGNIDAYPGTKELQSKLLYGVSTHNCEHQISRTIHEKCYTPCL